LRWGNIVSLERGEQAVGNVYYAGIYAKKRLYIFIDHTK